jgi:hypothetical protein
MTDTPFELGMDEFMRQNLPWRTWVQFKNAAGNWETNQFDIKENLPYRVGFRATNGGSETYVKNVEIRVVNAYPARVTFFSDDTYTQVVPRHDRLFPDTLAPGQVTPWHWVHFRLGAGPDEQDAQVASVGVYAEIVPQGHYWRSFMAPLD